MDANADASEVTTKDELREFIRSLLPEIDDYLTSLNAPLRERLFRAGSIIVKDFIIKVSIDENKDDFIEKPWFAIIYYHINEWYRERYGPLLEKNASGFARGVVLVRAFPIELNVPLTRSRVEAPDETAWLYFPVDVDSTEDALKWLVDAPSLDGLAEADLKDVCQNANHVAASLRAIRQYSLGVVSDGETVSGLIEGVLPELEAAANHILRNDCQSIGLALWSMQMACERVLKAFCQQRGASFRLTHDLFVLFDDAAKHGLNADRNLLTVLPRSEDAVALRYGLGEARSLRQIMIAYSAALSLVSAVVKSLRRENPFAGGGVLLRKFPFITLPPSG